MADPMSIFCYFHIGGEIVRVSNLRLHYEGGRTVGRIINEGLSMAELITLIGTWVSEDVSTKRLKYTVKYDACELLDLVDNDGIRQLIQLNENCGHVYVMDGRETSSTRQTEQSHCSNSLSREVITGSAMGREIVDLPCALQSAPATQLELTCAKYQDSIVGCGQIFENAVELRQAIYKYSICHKFEYTFVRNSPQKIIVKCKVDGCNWKLTAYAVAGSTAMLSVKTFFGEHEHSAQDNLGVMHNRRSNLTAAVMVDNVRSCVDKSPNDIRNDMFRDYGVALTYKQAWMTKERCLADIHGATEYSYMLIPWLCNRLMETDPQTVAKWTASEAKHFERLFIAYGCCVTGFLLGSRPILYIDGCHLSGPYKGTLLAACAYDADNNLYPFSYAIVGGETYEDWLWFLQNIKELTGSVQIVLVSDRHNAIKSAVRDVFGVDRHAFCYRHVKENFSAEFARISKGSRRNMKADALKILDAIAYARIECNFLKAMQNMRSFSPELARWVEIESDVDRWALSRFPYRRWDNITTNLAESFNAWLVKERKHNVCVLINEHRDKLAKKLYACKEQMGQWKNGVGPYVESTLKEHVARAEHLHAEHYGPNRILVRTGRTDLSVNVALRECTCQAWQMSGIPCPHACAAIKKLHGNVYSYVEECYSISSQQKIYANTMVPVETHDMPNLNQLSIDDYFTYDFLQPPITTRVPGRPAKKRRESQFQDKAQYRCSRCHDIGHNRSKCRNPNPECW